MNKIWRQSSGAAEPQPGAGDSWGGGGGVSLARVCAAARRPLLAEMPQLRRGSQIVLLR